MAIYKIHSVDGGYVPPHEDVYINQLYYDGEKLPTGLPLVITPGDPTTVPENISGATHILMSEFGDHYYSSNAEANCFEGAARAVRVTENIVFKDENGTKYRKAN